LIKNLILYPVSVVLLVDMFLDFFRDADILCFKKRHLCFDYFSLGYPNGVKLICMMQFLIIKVFSFIKEHISVVSYLITFWFVLVSKGILFKMSDIIFSDLRIVKFIPFFCFSVLNIRIVMSKLYIPIMNNCASQLVFVIFIRNIRRHDLLLFPGCFSFFLFK